MGSMNAGNVLDNLQRQVDELEALQAMFPDVQVLEMSALEQQIYATAKLIVDGVEDDLAQNAVSATIRIPYVQLNGSPVKLRFVLGESYPDSPARLTVECDGPRSDHDALVLVLQQCQEQCEGSEVLLLAVDSLKDAVEQLQQAKDATAGASADAPRSAASAQASSARACAVVWFHHIKALEKRKFIVSRARDLGVRGYSKPGFPGIIVAEGPEEQLDDYISSIRALRWQAMQVRAREQLPAAAQTPSAAASGSSLSGGVSCFSQPFTELEETGMSELSQHCSAAGVEHLFLAALKISK